MQPGPGPQLVPNSCLLKVAQGLPSSPCLPPAGLCRKAPVSQGRKVELRGLMTGENHTPTGQVCSHPSGSVSGNWAPLGSGHRSEDGHVAEPPERIEASGSPQQHWEGPGPTQSCMGARTAP